MKKPIIGLNVDFKDGQLQIGCAYIDAVIAAGGLPLLVPCHRSEKLLGKYVALAAGFVFIGGRDYPCHYYGAKPGRAVRPLPRRRAEADLCLAKMVLARNMPVLGVCGGHQLISIALGGKLIQHVPGAGRHQGGGKHQVVIAGGNILRRLFGRKKITVNSHHHQAVEPDCPGAGLEPVAFSGPGRILEAFESVRHPFVLGLQWHPERMPWRSHGARIFGALIKAAQKEI